MGRGRGARRRRAGGAADPRQALGAVRRARRARSSRCRSPSPRRAVHAARPGPRATTRSPGSPARRLRAGVAVRWVLSLAMDTTIPAGYVPARTHRPTTQTPSPSCCAPASSPTSGAAREHGRRREGGMGDAGARARARRLGRAGRRRRAGRVRARDGADLLVAVHPESDRARPRDRAAACRAERRARARAARVVATVRARRPNTARARRSCWRRAGGRCTTTSACEIAAQGRAAAAAGRGARVRRASSDVEEVWHLVQGAYSDVEGHLPQSLEGWRATAMDKPELGSRSSGCCCTTPTGSSGWRWASAATPGRSASAS